MLLLGESRMADDETCLGTLNLLAIIGNKMVCVPLANVGKRWLSRNVYVDEALENTCEGAMAQRSGLGIGRGVSYPEAVRAPPRLCLLPALPASEPADKT